MKMNMFISVFLSIVGLAVSYSCYGFGIYRVWSGAISYGTMTMFLSLAGNLTGTFNQLTSLVPTAVSITTSARRLMDILQMPKEDYSKRGMADRLKDENKNDGLAIKVNGLSYAYNNGNEVFSGASFQAAPHEIIALVGPSGEGKTTMLRIILGLLMPKEGSVTIEGMTNNEYMEISPSTRMLFSYVPQGNTMFQDL